uniref:Uncharacterized protein n=1 Tax=Glossina austeni TaxID=7395 RepID=A0A1A9VJ22_GLOAU
MERYIAHAQTNRYVLFSLYPLYPHMLAITADFAHPIPSFLNAYKIAIVLTLRQIRKASIKLWSLLSNQSRVHIYMYMRYQDYKVAVGSRECHQIYQILDYFNPSIKPFIL